jgi:hypothetical protein
MLGPFCSSRKLVSPMAARSSLHLHVHIMALTRLLATPSPTGGCLESRQCLQSRRAPCCSAFASACVRHHRRWRRKWNRARARTGGRAEHGAAKAHPGREARKLRFFRSEAMAVFCPLLFTHHHCAWWCDGVRHVPADIHAIKTSDSQARRCCQLTALVASYRPPLILLCRMHRCAAAARGPAVGALVCFGTSTSCSWEPKSNVAVQNELQRLLVEFDAIATDGKLGKKQFSSQQSVRSPGAPPLSPLEARASAPLPELLPPTTSDCGTKALYKQRVGVPRRTEWARRQRTRGGTGRCGCCSCCCPSMCTWHARPVTPPPPPPPFPASRDSSDTGPY